MPVIPQGIIDANFYELINQVLALKGYTSLAEYIRIAPNYWFDDEVWRQLFPLSAYENPTRAFEQKIGDTYVPVMATYLSDEAETPLISNEGFEMRTAEIPRMGQGYLFTAKSYEDARKLGRLGITPLANRVYENLFLDLNKLLRGIHTQRSFTSLQIESKGHYITTKSNNVGGFTNFKIDMNPLVSNKKKTGFGPNGAKYPWSESRASPIGDLQDLFDFAVQNRILSEDPADSVFRMNKGEFDTFRNHATVKKAVALWKTGYLVSDATNLAAVTVTEGDLASYLESLGLPRISISKTFGYSQRINANQEIEKYPIPAFADNTVVLRPNGAIGQMQWCRVSNIFSTNDVPMYYTEGGAIAIQEDTYARAKGKKFSAESLCVPVPSAIERLIYLQTNLATEGR